MWSSAMAADRVAQIITFGTLLARGVMRDVGRVLGLLRYGEVDRLTKLVPNNPRTDHARKGHRGGAAIARGSRGEREHRPHARYRAEKLEGLYRHASTHAAGIVIGDRPFRSSCRSTRSEIRDAGYQFNMKWVGPAGLVKFDFLGLKTLTVLQGAVKILEEQGRRSTCSRSRSMMPRVMPCCLAAETVGVFQVESGGMACAGRYAPGPDRGYHRAGRALSAGSDGEYPVYCDVKHGRAKADYPHPSSSRSLPKPSA